MSPEHRFSSSGHTGPHRFTAEPETWLSVMPPIPLADYFGPLRTPGDPMWRAVAVGHDIAPSTTRVIGMSPVYPEREVVNGWLADSILVPDLDRHEGFGKALRHLRNNGGCGPVYWAAHGVGGLVNRFWTEQTTEADRLAVAHALAGR